MEKESTILELYERFEQEKKNSPKFYQLLRKFSEQKELLEKTLSNKQQKKLQKLIEIMYDLRTQESKEIFVDGFSMATKIMTEVFYNEDTN